MQPLNSNATTVITIMCVLYINKMNSCMIVTKKFNITSTAEQSI